MDKDVGNLQKATLGGGCFWGMDRIVEGLEGEQGGVVGEGGSGVPNPT